MHREEYHGFYNWLAGVFGAAALALFMFSLTLSAANKSFHAVSTHLFLGALPFLAFTCFLAREVKEKKLTTETADNAIFWLALSGLSMLSAGLVFLFLAVGAPYLVITLVVTVASGSAWTVRAYRSIKHP